MTWKISFAELDNNLYDDLWRYTDNYDNLDRYRAFEFPYDRATYSNQCFHVVHSVEDQRGGIVLVGSVSSGETFWTRAASPEEVFDRFNEGKMEP